jgi:hypothetical protein
MSKVYSLYLEAFKHDLLDRYRYCMNTEMYDEANIVALIAINFDRMIDKSNFTINREELYR